MKKLSKKWKIIILIATMLVAIIITLIITTNIIKKKIGNEAYFSTTANANSNLVSRYIKEGITIGGITGTLKILDTSDANATPEDIIWGETAYVKGVKIVGTKIVTIAHAKESKKTFEENTVLLDEYGNRIKIPAGFKIAEDSAINVTDGVVIEDVNAGDNNTKGSQFVWVPIGNVTTDNNNNFTKIDFGRYSVPSEDERVLVQLADNYKDETILNDHNSYFDFRELLKTTDSTNVKAKDLEDFVLKSKSSGGYYIGRYEGGDSKATSPRTGTTTESNPNNPVVCKKGVYPYNYVSQADAASLSRNMYNNSNFESDLVNSFAWDTAVTFIEKFSGDENYGFQEGKNTQETISKCGESILSNVDSGDIKEDVRCNIFDMAGNTAEWSTENYSNENNPSIARGGSYIDNGATVNRIAYHTIDEISFRVILYL